MDGCDPICKGRSQQGQLRTAKIAETRRKAQQVETIITWALALAIAILFFGVIVFVADAVL